MFRFRKKQKSAHELIDTRTLCRLERAGIMMVLKKQYQELITENARLREQHRRLGRYIKF